MGQKSSRLKLVRTPGKTGHVVTLLYIYKIISSSVKTIISKVIIIHIILISMLFSNNILYLKTLSLFVYHIHTILLYAASWTTHHCWVKVKKLNSIILNTLILPISQFSLFPELLPLFPLIVELQTNPFLIIIFLLFLH